MTRFADPTFLIAEAEEAARDTLLQVAALDYLWLLRSSKRLLDSIPRRPKDPARARDMQPHYKFDPMPLPKTIQIAKEVAARQRQDALAFLHFGAPLPHLEYDREHFEAEIFGGSL